MSAEPSRRVDAVIFDLDGTLADTLRDIAEAMNHALAARGMPQHAVATYRPLIGGGARDLAHKVLPPDAASQAQADEFLAAFRVAYSARLVVHTRPYAGVPELLSELSRRGLQLAVLSNKLDAATREIVATLFPDVRFAAVYGERPPLPRKPDPKTALLLADELGVPAARCAFVGDSEVDMKTALAAGMLPVGVLWGFRDLAELEASGARHVIAEPAALLDVLRG